VFQNTPIIKDGIPQAYLTEYLRLGPKGATGWNRAARNEVYPAGHLRNRYRTDPRSEFISFIQCMPQVDWNECEVTHEGLRRNMIYTSDPRYSRSRNALAKRLLSQSDTRFPEGEVRTPEQTPVGDVYFALGRVLKPYVDLKPDDFLTFLAPRLEKRARPLFSGWWHAIDLTQVPRTDYTGKWRFFADDLTELVHAKLVLSS
jgi:hypothetical protein